MKKPGSPPIVKIAILTVATTFLWIAFEVYRTLTIDANPVLPPEILEPIDPNLDLTTLNQLPSRIHLSDDEIGDTVIISFNTPLPISPEPSEESSPESQLNEQI